MIVFLGLLLVFLQDTPPFKNLDFELGKRGEEPPGWNLTTKPGYSATLSDSDPKQGTLCVVIERKKGEESKARYGVLMQTIAAAPYRGKGLLFRAYLRTEPQYQDNQAQMWVRVDREGKKHGFFDNMDDRPVRNADWGEYEIVADIDRDAETINFGLIHIGEGRIFWDDIRIEVLDPTRGTGNEPPRPLAGRAVDNVTAFARLLGYLRYFYPGDEAADANWERFAIEGVRAVESAMDPEKLARTLEELSRPIAPAVRVFASEKAAALEATFTLAKENASKIVFWHHFGVGISKRPGNVYQSTRMREEYAPGKKLDEKTPSPDQPYFADLGGGVSCLIPLALYEGESGTLPPAPKSPRGPPTAPRVVPSGNDRATRLADVALAWNVFQHFYPYFDVVKTDWLAVLPRTLQAAATDPDEFTFHSTLKRMGAQLHDGHGWVTFGMEPPSYRPPIAWDWIEDQLVITKVTGSDPLPVLPGDVVAQVNGVPARKALEEVEATVSSATPQWARRMGLQYLLWGEQGSTLSLAIQPRDGTPREIKLLRDIGVAGRGYEHPFDFDLDAPDPIDELAPGILYVDLTRINDRDFEQALPDLVKAQGIVFELRGYPNHISSSFLGHLSDKPLQSARWLIPEIRFPDRLKWSFDDSRRWTLEPKEPRLRAKIAFITDGRAISYAETLLGIVEHYKLGEIVGGPTAGTNGNVNPFALPGRYWMSWTGMKVLKHDGSVHHGVGILPTVPVSRTTRGVIEGEDEALEKAIEVVSR